MLKYRVVSSDNHVFEPPDLWIERMQPKFKERGPQVVREEDGDWYYCDGLKIMGTGEGTQTGLRFEEGGVEALGDTQTFEEVRLGGYIAEEHVKDMELDGVEVSVVYPTIGLNLYGVQDTELLTDTFRAYNDWLADWCSPFPKRLKGIAMINVDDVPSAVKELERCAKMGLGGVMIPVFPSEGMRYFEPVYENFWAAAQDARMPIGLHIATNRPGPGQEMNVGITVSFVFNADHWPRMSMGDMIFSGVFERYPKLYVGAVEQEMSWAPHFIERMDYNYTQRIQALSPYKFKNDMLPSDFFRSNCFLSFQEDTLGIKMRDFIGVDTLMWGSDYPHIESTFPKTQEILEEMLVDCTEEEKAKLVGGNAARVYNL